MRAPSRVRCRPSRRRAESRPSCRARRGLGRASGPQLQELKDRIVKVQKDRSLAAELLPTGDGFFFGSTDYDEGYFADLDDTYEKLERILAHEDESIKYIYSANW